MKITRSLNMCIRLENHDSAPYGGFIEEQSVQANLLYAILEKLEKIRCGLIDVETQLEKINASGGKTL